MTTTRFPRRRIEGVGRPRHSSGTARSGPSSSGGRPRRPQGSRVGRRIGHPLNSRDRAALLRGEQVAVLLDALGSDPSAGDARMRDLRVPMTGIRPRRCAVPLWADHVRCIDVASRSSSAITPKVMRRVPAASPMLGVTARLDLLTPAASTQHSSQASFLDAAFHAEEKVSRRIGFDAWASRNHARVAARAGRLWAMPCR